MSRSAVHGGQGVETAHTSINRCTDKGLAACPHPGILSTLKRKAVLQYVTMWVNLWDIVLNKMCQPQQDKYCPQNIFCEISVMVRLKEPNSRMAVARFRGAETESHRSVSRMLRLNRITTFSQQYCTECSYHNKIKFHSKQACLVGQNRNPKP